MKLNYKSFGSGTPLIILHGLLGSLDNWQTLARKYAKHHTTFIIDLRNHGKSPHSDAFDYEQMVADLYEFMNDNHIYKSHLLGHSMGGKIVMQFALQHPDMVNKLIVADIAPVEYEPGHETIFNALLSIELSKYDSRDEVDDELAKSIKDYGVRQFLMKGLTRGENNEFIWKYNVSSLWNNYQKILSFEVPNSKFEEPTLFISGGNSKYVTSDHSEKIEALFPQTQYKVIQNAGHWLHAEKPKEFYELTQAFLNQ